MIELDPVDHITADAVGPPGHRTFYLQGRKRERLVTVLVEKQQVQLLAASVVEILSRVGKETGQGPPEEAMSLEEPLLPEWRAGRLSIGYQEERDLLLLEVEELLPEPEEEEGADEDEGDEEEEEEPEGLEALEAFEEDEGAEPAAGGGEEDAGESSLDAELGVVGLAAHAAEAGPDGESEEPAEPPPAESAPDVELELDELSTAARAEASDEREPERVRFWATREQMLSLARHGAAVCAAGRPRCQLCGAPLDPGEDHVCPALNGHRQMDAT